MLIKIQGPARLALIVLLGAISIAIMTRLLATETPSAIAPLSLDNPKAAGPFQTAVLAGGCFWGVEAVFEHVRGVRNVLSGYSGGNKATARYDIVSSGKSAHAESVQITFDPSKVSYGELLQIFFSVAHDPTQLNRQGPDHGTQYRSAIFYADEMQRKIAQSYIARLEKSRAFRRKIVTQVVPLKEFYAAEAYHQDFLIKNPRHPYIVIHDLPKIRNLRQVFPDHYVSRAATAQKSLILIGK